jgi:hypothetical protein
MQATRRTAMCSTNGSLPERPDRRQRSVRSRSAPILELTVSDTMQSFGRAPAVATDRRLQGYCSHSQ